MADGKTNALVACDKSRTGIFVEEKGHPDGIYGMLVTLFAGLTVRILSGDTDSITTTTYLTAMLVHRNRQVNTAYELNQLLAQPRLRESASWNANNRLKVQLAYLGQREMPDTRRVLRNNPADYGYFISDDCRRILVMKPGTDAVRIYRYHGISGSFVANDTEGGQVGIPPLPPDSGDPAQV